MTRCDKLAPAEPGTTSTTASTTSNVGADYDVNDVTDYNDVNHVTDNNNVTVHASNDVCANNGNVKRLRQTPTLDAYVNNDNVNGNNVSSDVDNGVNSNEPSTPPQRSGTMPSDAEVYLFLNGSFV